MERGGFHSYQKLPNTTSGMKVAELRTRVAEADMNHNNGCSNHPHNNNHLDDNECSVREQDRFMPIANVIRIMRKILPPHAKISDDAKETIQECVSEFISFITSEANDRCQREQRKTITAEDVLYAMSKLGFDDYIEPLTVYLQRYRELEGERGSMRGVPYLKRNVELGITAFGPAYAMTGGHQNGFFGVAMGAYSTRETTTNTTTSSSQAAAAAALANGEQAFAHHNMRG